MGVVNYREAYTRIEKSRRIAVCRQERRRGQNRLHADRLSVVCPSKANTHAQVHCTCHNRPMPIDWQNHGGTLTSTYHRNFLLPPNADAQSVVQTHATKSSRPTAASVVAPKVRILRPKAVL